VDCLRDPADAAGDEVRGRAGPSLHEDVYPRDGPRCCDTPPPSACRNRSWCRWPRLPTMRVMGSQFISTRPPLVLAAIAMTRPPVLQLLQQRGTAAITTSAGIRSSGPVRAAPLRLLVQRLRGEGRGATAARPPRAARPWSRGWPPGGSSHERHELVGKPHGAADADAADVGAAAHPADPSALGTLHLTTGPQQPSFTIALRRPVLVGRSRPAFVVTGAIANPRDRPPEEPQGAKLVVERDQSARCRAACQKVGDGSRPGWPGG